MKTTKRKYKLQWKNLLLSWLVIPAILFLLWIGFSLLFTSKYSLTVIAIPHDRSDFTSYKTTELLAKQKVSAQFEAKENNLGIVSVRFYNFERISEDSVTFRIKKVGEREWFYENTYTVDQFQPDEFFTFGFPLIPDSKGERYIYEIESIKGQPGDAIALSKINPPFVTQYQYSKAYLIENKEELVGFIFKKLYYSFADRNFLVSSLVYLLPLIFYLLMCWYVKIEIGIKQKPFPHPYLIMNELVSGSLKNRYTLVHIFLLTVLFLVIFMEESNGLTTVMLLLLWIWLVRLYRFNNTVSYAVAMFLLIACPILLIISQDGMAQRSAVWAYYFLVIGSVQALLEFRFPTKKSVNYSEFMKNNVAGVKNYITTITEKSK